jgi:predicted dithiol-disulfide oxidoreductase (DUF899 family)
MARRPQSAVGQGKALTQARDDVNTARRQLPMVEIDKNDDFHVTR